MRIALLKKVEDGIQPPTGNPFPLFIYDAYGDPRVGIWTIDTGLELVLPSGKVDGCLCDVSLQIWPVESVQIMAWSLSGYKIMNGPEFPADRLIVTAIMSCPHNGLKFAYAQMIEVKRASVRFMQKGPEGGRIVRGDAQVANCTENREPES